MSERYTDDLIIIDAYFGKIKHLPMLPGEVIKQFLDDVVYKHPNWNMLLANLSDIYVLVASFAAQKYLSDGEKTWKQIMKKEEYDILEKNRQFVVAYMMVKEKDQNNHYIELFDTVVRNNNLGRVMIQKYEKNYPGILVPQEIIESSALYWAKVLDFWDTDKKRIYKYSIEDFIKGAKLDSNDLRWKHLYDLCESDPEDSDFEER
jgi:hypothetical protein